jgi:hypothetical protein
MTREQVLDEILLGLADEFEAGNRNGRWFAPSCLEEFEPLRECFACMVADGFAWGLPTGKVWIVRLTPEATGTTSHA